MTARRFWGLVAVAVAGVLVLGILADPAMMRDAVTAPVLAVIVGLFIWGGKRLAGR